MGYATTTTGHVPNLKKSSDTRVVRGMWLNGWYAVLKQTAETTEEEWRGLSYSDALTLCISSEESILNGVSRSYLGGARVNQQQSGVSSWIYADAVWGTKITSSLEKMGDSSLYRVRRQTVVYDVSAGSGYLTKL